MSLGKETLASVDDEFEHQKSKRVLLVLSEDGTVLLDMYL